MKKKHEGTYEVSRWLQWGELSLRLAAISNADMAECSDF